MCRRSKLADFTFTLFFDPMLEELSRYRSRVLCSTVEPPPIGRLPVIDPSDAQNAVEFPQWHAYIQRV